MKRIKLNLILAVLVCGVAAKADIRPPRPFIDVPVTHDSAPWTQTAVGALLSAGIAMGGRWAWTRRRTQRSK